MMTKTLFVSLFVLAARHDPRLGLHRLRLEGQLAELRAAARTRREQAAPPASATDGESTATQDETGAEQGAAPKPRGLTFDGGNSVYQYASVSISLSGFDFSISAATELTKCSSGPECTPPSSSSTRRQLSHSHQPVQSFCDTEIILVSGCS